MGEHAVHDGRRHRFAEQLLLNEVLHEQFAAVIVRAHVDAHKQVVRLASHSVQRKRVDKATVYQQHLLASDGIEEQRNGDARPNGVIQASFAEDYLAAAVPIGRHGRIRNGKVLDVDVGNHLFQGVHHPVSLHQMVQTEREIDQREHLPTVEFEHPLLHFGQLSRRIHAADERTHRATRYRRNLIPAALQGFDGPDVSQSACPTARQCQCNLLLHAFINKRATDQSRRPARGFP